MGERYGEDSSLPRTGGRVRSTCEGGGGADTHCSLLFARRGLRLPGIARAIWSGTRGRSRCCTSRSGGRGWWRRISGGRLGAWAGLSPLLLRWEVRWGRVAGWRCGRFGGAVALSRCLGPLANQSHWRSANICPGATHDWGRGLERRTKLVMVLGL